MRRFLAVVAAVVSLLGVTAPSVSAQAPAPAPAPKVTITGLFEFHSSVSDNWSALDPTNAQDREWFSRERGVFFITGEVGRTKAVWAIELDFTNGAGQGPAGTCGAAPSCGTTGPSGAVTHAGTSATFDLDTDVAGFAETKWLYLETPLTGPGSIMPFIPVPTLMRMGAQPARGHDYKLGMMLSGDIPAVTLETTWAPNVRSTLTYVQIGEKLEPVSAFGQTEDWAIVSSVEWDIFKGLTVKPTYSYADYTGGNTGTNNHGTEPKNGFTQISATGYPFRLWRHTIGGDVRYTMAGFTISPTFYYQFGKQETQSNLSGKDSVDLNAWIFDLIAGYRIGPLNIEGRAMYTPGMRAQDCVEQASGATPGTPGAAPGTGGSQCPASNRGKDVKYYQAINTGGGFMGGWSELQASTTESTTTMFAGATGMRLSQSPSYDKYGRLFIALAADYALTPALTFKALVNASWTDQKVDTNGLISTNGMTSPTEGDDKYLGTEFDLGMQYRFAPNVTFDLFGGYMWTGDAMRNSGCASGCGTQPNATSSNPGGTPRDVHDAWKFGTRIRFTF